MGAAVSSTAGEAPPSQEIVLHGHRQSYRTAGSGPLLVLIHGITGSSSTWLDVLPALAERFTVLAPDLLGHGESAKPRGDYSLGAYASGLRDLLEALGHERATVVGHSLGGGVAMQMAYQFPERCERLALVSSGGLGREVNGLLRAATLPGAEWVLPLLAGRHVLRAGTTTAAFFGRFGLRAGPDLEELWHGFASLGDTETRQAFLHTLSTLMDPGGQRVNATDRLYLARALPTLVVWGAEDRIIPAGHAQTARMAVPEARVEVFPGAGHFPHRSDPRRFVRLLVDFVDSTEPAAVDNARWRELLVGGAAAAGASPARDPGPSGAATGAPARPATASAGRSYPPSGGRRKRVRAPKRA